MRALFVMDPLSTIHVDQDSSYVLMLAWQARGGEAWHCGPRDLFVVGDMLYANASRLVVGPRPKVAEIVEKRTLPHSELAAIFKRTDPPFDMTYVFATYQLDVAARDIPVVNAPHALRDANEKMVILRYPDLITPTLVTFDIDRIRAFVAEQGGRAIVKPWDGNGGRGIFVLDESDPNLGVILETSTANGREAVMAQRYIPEIVNGDKRILLVDGEPRGAFLRVPPENDHRGNMHVGASVEPCDMTERDLHICARLRPYLKENGLVFTGIDVIGECLTEVNVTSPTGIQECTTLYGTDIAAEVVDVAIARSNP
jgi:glutathione synthase